MCPACGEEFSRREFKLRDAHMMEEHHSYLRWKCQCCNYVTSTHRRHDHVKHWTSRHVGEPAVPPRPFLVSKEDEDRRRSEDRQRRESRRRSASRETPASRYSPRRRQPSPGKRGRHPSSPGSSSTPGPKRSSTRSGSRRPSTETAASVPPTTPPSPPRDQQLHRSPRKPREPRRIVRRESGEQPRATETAAQPVAAPPPRDPTPSPSRPSTSHQPIQDEELSIHAGEGEFDEVAGTPSPAASTTHAGAEDLCITLDQVLQFCREKATPDDCRAVSVALAERRATFPPEPPPAQPVPGVRRATRDVEEGPVRTRLTWRPGGGLTIDSGTVHFQVDGPVEETSLSKR